MRLASRNEAGETLIETIIAIPILGLAVTAILGSIAAGIFTSDIHRKQADADTVLLSAAESIKNPASNPFQTCATPSSYNPTNGVTLPSGWSPSSVRITSVKYWNGTSFTTTCSDTDALGHILRLQQIDLSVTSPDARASLTMSAVKGNR